MSISCYIIIQIVSEEIYFLKGSLFKAGEAKIRHASCVLLRAHACPERGQTSTELLSTLSSRLYSPQPRVAFSDERFLVQISSFLGKKTRECGPMYKPYHPWGNGLPAGVWFLGAL